MDAKVPDSLLAAGTTHEDFLLNEGLEVLATYRSIRSDEIRLVVREMIAAMARAADGLP